MRLLRLGQFRLDHAPSPRLPSSLCSSKNLVQVFLPLLDQPLGGRDDFFGQEFEQVVLIGEGDGLQYTLVFKEVLAGRTSSPRTSARRTSARRTSAGLYSSGPDFQQQQ